MGIFNRRRGAILAAISIASLLPIHSVAWAQDAPTGSLSWGIRASFDNYTSGATFIEDGATRQNNAFNFPLASYSFDREAERTEAQFTGTVRYRKYCGGSSEKDLSAVCQLDLTFKNPKVVIDKDGSYVEATVRSRQYEKNTFYEPKEPVKVATLATVSGNFTKDNGQINWSRIPTRLTEEGVSMFSGFYERGEGLDPLSFTATGDGARPSTDKGLSVFPTNWTADTKYDDLHSLYAVGNNVLVAIAKKGLFLVSPEMKTIGTTEIPLSQNGIGSFDAETGYYYFTEYKANQLTNELKRVKVNATSFGSVETVGTVPGNIYAVGIHPKTKKGIVISVEPAATSTSPADDQAAYLTPLTGSTLGDSLKLPTSSQVIGNAVSGDSIFAPRFFFGAARTQLLPMDDGTFVYYANSEPVIFPGDSIAAKNVLLSIDPAATTPEQAVSFMRQSQPETSVDYLEGYTTNGRQIIRWNKNTVASYAKIEVLDYANRQVTSAGRKQPPAAGVAGVTWDADNNPVMYSGNNSKLIWFDLNTLTPVTENGEPKESVIPNGRETNNVYQPNMITTPNGSLYVPSLNESRGDHMEYYELVRLFDASKQAQDEPTEEEKQRQKQREEEARKKLVQLNFDEAKASLTKAKEELAKAEADKDAAAIDKAKKAVAEAEKRFEKAAEEYHKEFPDHKPPTNPGGGSGSSSPGAIAGIVIGVLALIGAVVAAISQFLPQLSGMFKNLKF